MVAAQGRPKMFFGWWLVAAIFLIVFFTGGIGFATFTVFVTRLVDEFGWSLTMISSAVSVWACVYTVAGPLAGLAVARFGARPVMLVSSVVGVVGSVLMATMHGPVQFFIAIAMWGVTCAGTTFVPTQTLITTWFQRYRGRAMGLMMVGYGLGGAVLTPVTNTILERFGLRAGYWFNASAMALAVIPMILAFVRNRPSDLGLQPDGAEVEPGAIEESVVLAPSVPFADAVRSWSYLGLLLIMFCQVYGQGVLGVHFVPFVEGAGLSRQMAANTWGLTLTISIAGFLLAGMAAERISPKVLVAAIGVLFAMAVGSLEIFVVHFGSRSLIPFGIFSLCHGLAVGGAGTVLPILLAWCFGPRDFARLSGLSQIALGLPLIVAAPSAGLIRESQGSYELAFLLCIVGYIVSSAIALAVSNRRLLRVTAATVPGARPVEEVAF